MHAVQQHVGLPTSYESPTTLGEALDLLHRLGRRARPIAGGTDLLLELTRGVRSDIDTLIDLTRIPGLDGIAVEDGVARLGPLVTHNMVVASDVLVDGALPLAQACFEVGAPQLRNRATVAGNVVTASPANDTISALLALDASVTLRSTRGSRTLPVSQFFAGLRQTALAPDELLTSIDVPLLVGDERGVFVKLGLRRAQAISVVHLAIVVAFDGDTVRRARLALGSVAPQVILVPDIGAALRGRPLDEAAIDAAVKASMAAASPIDDLRGSAEYRAATLATMVRRALETLRDRTERERWPVSAPLLWGHTDGRFPTGDTIPLSVRPGDQISCTINGLPVRAGDAAGRTLLEWLRDHAIGPNGERFTGTKEGCAEGECGACTMHLDGIAVLSCLVPAARAAGAEIATVEGLANLPSGALHPIQQAFIDCAAVQCGYCIPGFLMSGSALLEERSEPSRADIEVGLSGNLCRCTGYYRIMHAIGQAATAAGTPEISR